MSKSREQNPYFGHLIGLGSWFERQKRVLPWRSEPTVYRVWISEVMLQQTQVVTVVPYFEKFVARFPTVEILAASPEKDVLEHWAGLGYYSRARNIHKTAHAIVKQGRFPETRDQWLEMPGVGEYTAGAILSISQNEPEAILDGNVERVLSRVRLVSRERGDAAYKARLWRLSHLAVQSGVRVGVNPSVLNQAWMELGATVCVPRTPRCGVCPVATACRAQQLGVQEHYPPRKKPTKWIAVREQLCLLIDAGERILLRQRRAGEWREGLWDLPEQGSKLQHLCADAERVGRVETRHVVTRHKITRETEIWRTPSAAHRVDGVGYGAAESGSGEYCWVDLEQLLGAPGAAVPAGSALKRTLREVGRRLPGVYRSTR